MPLSNTRISPSLSTSTIKIEIQDQETLIDIPPTSLSPTSEYQDYILISFRTQTLIEILNLNPSPSSTKEYNFPFKSSFLVLQLVPLDAHALTQLR